MANITPITLGLPQQTGTTLSVTILSFDIETTTGLSYYWQVKNADGITIDDGNGQFSQEEYDDRDGTNEYIFLTVMSHLGLSAL